MTDFIFSPELDLMRARVRLRFIHIGYTTGCVYRSNNQKQEANEPEDLDQDAAEFLGYE